MKLEPSIDLLVRKGCILLKEGILSHEGEARVCLLFNSVFIVAESKDQGERLLVKGVLRISKCEVASLIDSAYLGLYYGFQVISKAVSFLLCSPTLSIKQEWVEAISSCIRNAQEKKKSEIAASTTRRRKETQNFKDSPREINM